MIQIFDNRGISAHREHFPFVSQAIAGMYSMFPCTSKVLGMVLFFAPPLGVFDLQRHHQAEQTQWNNFIREEYVSHEGFINLGTYGPIKWSDINRWTIVDGIPQAPSYKLFTVFSLWQYFLMLLGKAF